MTFTKYIALNKVAGVFKLSWKEYNSIQQDFATNKDHVGIQLLNEIELVKQVTQNEYPSAVFSVVVDDRKVVT